jgi:hypothetical protein
VAPRVIEFRFMWDCRERRIWIRNYWIGEPTSGGTDEQLLAAFFGKMGTLGGWLERWASIMTITNQVRLATAQFIIPDRGYVEQNWLLWRFLTGLIVTGTQPWNATCRINWNTSSTSTRPKWQQISPVPQFSPILGVDQAEYLDRVRHFADWYTAPFVTADGDSWQGACRQSDGSYWPILSYSLALFGGRAKHRQRVV